MKNWAGVKKCSVRSLHTWVSPSFDSQSTLTVMQLLPVTIWKIQLNLERWSPPPQPMKQLGQRFWPLILQNTPQLSPAQYPSSKCTGFTHLTKEMMLVHFRQSGTGQNKRKRDTLKMFVSPPPPVQGVDGWQRYPSFMGPGNWQSKVAKRMRNTGDQLTWAYVCFSDSIKINFQPPHINLWEPIEMPDSSNLIEEHKTNYKSITRK